MQRQDIVERSPTDLINLQTKALNILIIEDSEADALLLETMLQDISNDISIFTHAVPRLADAFKIVDKENFDLIMLDLNLLDIQGVASVAALHAEAPNTPIIVCSGMDDPKMHKEALLCGAEYYLVKGRQTPNNLREVIHDVLSKQTKG